MYGTLKLLSYSNKRNGTCTILLFNYSCGHRQGANLYSFYTGEGSPLPPNSKVLTLGSGVVQVLLLTVYRDWALRLLRGHSYGYKMEIGARWLGRLSHHTAWIQEAEYAPWRKEDSSKSILQAILRCRCQNTAWTREDGL